MRKSLRATAAAFVLLFNTLAPASAQTNALRRPATDTDQRVEAILSKMTLEEKIDMLGGTDGFFVRDLPRLNLPKLKMADGPIGVRNFGPATAMAAGVSLAATWNPELAERVGTEIGRDARAKGVHFLLGPGVNIYRAPMNGRNFEYFGEDPFLASRIAVGYIRGVQSQGVSATVKHFMANNSEFDRHNSDSVVDERTMREIYMPVFEAAVKEARVGAMMDSYNVLNGVHASQNPHLLTEVARQEWGFNGLMMSDWFATYDGVGAANAGQDLEMPFAAFMNRKTLVPAVEQGKVTQATIDEHVRRILRTAARFGWLDRDQTDASIPRFNQQGRQAALQGAREGMVLLKNDGNLLPLDRKRLKTILVVGPDAYPAVPVGGGSARVEPFAAVSFLEGLSNALGSKANVLYHRGIPTLSELAESTEFKTAADSTAQPGLRVDYFSGEALTGNPAVTRTEHYVNFGRDSGNRNGFPEGTLSSRRTGFYTPQSAGAYDIFTESTGEDGGFHRLYVDDKLVVDNWQTSRTLSGHVTLQLDARPHKFVLEQRGRSGWLGSRLKMGVLRHGSAVVEEAKRMAAKADVVVVCAGFAPETESEGADRTYALPVGQDDLISAMASANKNTVVVVTSGGGYDTGEWIDRVPALLQAWYPGQEGGTAFAEILLGDVNPSGHLPITFERRWEDNPAHDSYYPTDDTKQVVYKEGVFIGYRGYEKNNTKPLFPFGHGLSYTTFKYSNLTVRPAAAGAFSDPPGARYEVSFDVTNTGKREGADVAQVYVGDTHSKVARPLKELKGFSKVNLRPGETRRVAIMLDTRAFAYYDADAKRWHTDPGDFDILVGRSSEQIELRGKITVK
ncbi:MAG TPA: glycoside hydrolase family 3 C-terminal domain-containing protein [Pyrinomonadaceae bacterium]|jgi:beta-glucosidase|nr:glycoside hydrolase family 3 C-terminal domain-containing protein [Pyrinomonadaceae bacterium]